MQKKTKMWLGAGAAGLLALGGLAGLANADMKGGMMGGMMDGMGHGRGHHGMQMMERYDANKDGKLSQEEIDTNRTQWLGEFDADKNGTLSLDEFKNLWMKARNEEMVREFQSFDRDGNAQVTLDEYKQPLANLVSEMDRNGDGLLSRDDHRERHGKRGDRMRHRKDMGQGMDEGMGQGGGNAPEVPAEEGNSQ